MACCPRIRRIVSSYGWIWVVMAIAIASIPSHAQATPDIDRLGDAPPAVDADMDGFMVPTDCDDTDPLINPAATEICDGVDNDCSGMSDDPFSIGSACVPTATGDCLAGGSTICLTTTSTTCDPEPLPAGPCRASVGACDIAESCDGTAITCPSDVLIAAATSCRGASTACDVGRSLRRHVGPLPR